ncbi:MAG: 50S ribosomal protein L23 [Oscillospiraceae bacterium]|nr:50S ribosomal protein L23 [Oscillospiraceae bacterium]
MKRTAYDVVIRPIISEQSMEDMDIKKYVFEVAKDATKPEIASAIEEIFDVRVIKVTTTHVRGKTRRVGANPQGTSRSWKKAVVKLSEDSKTIEIFENMA